MKKIILKLVLVLVLVFIPIFSSLAQAPDPLTQDPVVETSGYSILGPSAVIFGGYFSGNVQGRGFTTYFQFKKNDSNLDSNAEETIKIVRDNNGSQSGEFYTSPELNLFSTYYFRAVGYFNHNPTQKFYGGVLSLRTGYIPVGLRYPFAVEKNGSPVNCVSIVKNVCKKDAIGGGGGGGGIEENKDKDAPDGGSGLVPCDGSAARPCGFNQILELINKVINFLFVGLVMPLAAIMFAYAGFLLLTSGGDTEAKAKAKGIFTSVVIGLIVAAAAFLIIKTVLLITGVKTDGWNWFGFLD